MQEPIISREFNVIGSDEKLVFKIAFPIERGDGLYESTYILNFRKYHTEINVPGFSNFDVISSCFVTIGLKIRSIIRKEVVKFDFDGLEIDDLFPLSNKLKQAGDWFV